MIGEYRLEMHYPIAALTSLAVGNAQKARPECGAHGREYFTRVGKRNAADKMDVPSRHSLTCSCSVDGPEHGDQRRKIHPALALRHGSSKDPFRFRRGGASLSLPDQGNERLRCFRTYAPHRRNDFAA